MNVQNTKQIGGGALYLWGSHPGGVSEIQNDIRENSGDQYKRTISNTSLVSARLLMRFMTSSNLPNCVK